MKYKYLNRKLIEMFADWQRMQNHMNKSIAELYTKEEFEAIKDRYNSSLNWQCWGKVGNENLERLKGRIK